MFDETPGSTIKAFIDFYYYYRNTFEENPKTLKMGKEALNAIRKEAQELTICPYYSNLIGEEYLMGIKIEVID